MKSFLCFFFILIVSSHTYSQITTFDNLPISRVFILDLYNNHYSSDEAVVVPNGKLWYINGDSSGNTSTPYSLAYGQIKDYDKTTFRARIGHIYPEGYKLWYSNQSSLLNIIEYDLDAQTISLNTNNIKLDNKIQLFPNPTNSRLSLNSDKNYNIEVFDLNGRKIMEVEGNNLDMSNLSKATYIVKAFDKASKETYSYKVIRN